MSFWRIALDAAQESAILQAEEYLKSLHEDSGLYAGWRCSGRPVAASGKAPSSTATAGGHMTPNGQLRAIYFPACH